jgi:hypothetical protein
MPITECSCGSKQFLMLTEKYYRGEIEDGVLRCEAYSQDIKEIRCRECYKLYLIKSFSEVDY